MAGETDFALQEADDTLKRAQRLSEQLKGFRGEPEITIAPRQSASAPPRSRPSLERPRDVGVRIIRVGGVR